MKKRASNVSTFVHVCVGLCVYVCEGVAGGGRRKTVCLFAYVFDWGSLLHFEERNRKELTKKQRYKEEIPLTYLNSF